jgi:DsbC/DsbD-like thiol-disulfide interchange protein
MIRPFVSIAAVVLTAASCRADAPVAIDAALAPAKLAPGAKAVLTLTLKIAPNFHIYANDPGDKFAVPTSFEAAAVSGAKNAIALGRPAFPAPQIVDGLNIHEGTVVVKVPVTVPKSTKAGLYTLSGKVRYQACNQSSCLPPTSVPVSAILTVGR